MCLRAGRRSDAVSAKYSVATAQEYGGALADPKITAVAIAAPAAQYYELAKRVLSYGKDVYVESGHSGTQAPGDLFRLRPEILDCG